MKLLNYESPLMKTLDLVADVLIISLLWILTSIPIITIGTSTAAGYYVISRRISNREHYILKDYFLAFRNNFKNATLAFITIIPLLLLLVFNIFNSGIFGAFEIIAYPLYIVLGVELVFVYIHVFPLAARFDMKYMQLMKSAFLMANRHFIVTIVHVLLLAAALTASIFYPPFLLFSFGTYCWASSHLLVKVYRKYRPEFDRDTADIDTE